MRIYAHRVVTGETLHSDLPVTGPVLSRTFSGAHSLRARMEPAVYRELVTGPHSDGLPVLTPWATFLLAADDSGTLRFGGPLMRGNPRGPEYELEASSTSAWLRRQLWLSPRYYLTSETDVAQVIRDLVAETQGKRDSVPITVTGSERSGITVGGPEEDVDFETGSGEQVEFTAGPYEVNRADGTFIGDEIDDLASQEPGLDYVDEIAGTPEAPEFRLHLGYPRVGGRRHRLTFDTDWNITVDVPELNDGDGYAKTMLGIGRGEGDSGLTALHTVPAELIPQVMDTFQRKDLGAKQLRTVTRRRATAASRMTTIPSVAVRDTSHTPLWSWSPGDDIYVSADTPWGEVALWCRVVSDETGLVQREATLELEPAGSFVYGRPL